MIPVIGIVQWAPSDADRTAICHSGTVCDCGVDCLVSYSLVRCPQLNLESLPPRFLVCDWLPTFRLATGAAAYALYACFAGTPDNAIAEGNLGAALADMGLQNQAAIHLVTAIRLTPLFLPPHYTLAWSSSGRIDG